MRHIVQGVQFNLQCHDRPNPVLIATKIDILDNHSHMVRHQWWFTICVHHSRKLLSFDISLDLRHFLRYLVIIVWTSRCDGKRIISHSILQSFHFLKFFVQHRFGQIQLIR